MQQEVFFELWVYLSQEPLLGLTVTLVAYLLGDWLHRKSGRSPLVNPVLIAVIVLVGMLWVTQTEYEAYFKGAQFVHFLLGPATVALAVPLYRNLQRMKEVALPLGLCLIFGSLTASISAVAVAWLLGVSEQTLLSLAPKSVTTPVAMGVTEQLGGLPSLTAVLVIITGILGATFGTWTLNALKVRDWRARGFAVGVASHGIGTARAFQLNEVAGAYSSLALGLNALATAILVPLLFRLL
ncbi:MULTISPECIES: LrgB family protein [Limibacillus]|jgi:predicted murein hydrolase (TIGR00659 family)|uniref:Putative murein hydrolase (TIGR00659 family) n=1 Tax=Limibacillus halophilus TaxID=1579333 RepID=A0A839SXH9_9PROT|nr:LrgB family protein [Limibacillus halophilus]MBB3065725.1 putative murein hydrolase (TIGR00659 family) [Limibacillus halophilus]